MTFPYGLKRGSQPVEYLLRSPRCSCRPRGHEVGGSCKDTNSGIGNRGSLRRCTPRPCSLTSVLHIHRAPVSVHSFDSQRTLASDTTPPSPCSPRRRQIYEDMIFTQALVVLFASLSASVSARATPVSGDAASMVERDAGVALVAWPARALPDHLARRKVERGTDLTNGERMKR